MTLLRILKNDIVEYMLDDTAEIPKDGIVGDMFDDTVENLKK